MSTAGLRKLTRHEGPRSRLNCQISRHYLDDIYGNAQSWVPDCLDTGHVGVPSRPSAAVTPAWDRDYACAADRRWQAARSWRSIIAGALDDFDHQKNPFEPPARLRVC
jgi:hypothetical protein